MSRQTERMPKKEKIYFKHFLIKRNFPKFLFFYFRLAFRKVGISTKEKKKQKNFFVFPPNHSYKRTIKTLLRNRGVCYWCVA
jgi:hypothetical protein